MVPGLARGLTGSLGLLRRGAGDPTMRHEGGDWWRVSRTPDGPATTRFTAEDADVRVAAWGPGAGWAVAAAPRLLGVHDDPGGFRPDHPMLRRLVHDHPHLRVGATGVLLESLAPTIIEQRVTGAEAYRAIHRLSRRFGDPAPGPLELRVPLSAEQWIAIPSWEYLKAGVDPGRARAVVLAATRVGALERALARPDADPDRILRSLPGIGPWTAAKVRQQVFGDPDAWSTGDYHVPGLIGTVLVGHAVANDEAERLLEPYRGHRYRVELLAWALGRPERRGPRRPLPTHLPH